MTNKNNLLPFFCVICFTPLVWFFSTGLAAHDMPNINTANQLNTVPAFNFAKGMTNI